MIISIDAAKLFDLGYMFAKITSVYTSISKIIFEVPQDIGACFNIGYEGYDVILFIIKHWNILNDATVVITNLTANWYSIATDVYLIFTSVVAYDFYNSGMKSGELILTLLN